MMEDQKCVEKFIRRCGVWNFAPMKLLTVCISSSVRNSIQSRLLEKEIFMKKRLLKTAMVFLFLGTVAGLRAQDSISDLFKSKVRGLTETALTQDQMIGGLKEALAKGVDHAVTNLNRPGGFLNNLSVRITIPEKLQPMEKTLRALNQDYLVDDLLTNMNRAAEMAVGEVGPIFGDAIRQMTLADAKSLVNGPQDAATQYFRKVSLTRLQEKMQPIIQSATDKAGVTSSYKQVMQKAQTGFSIFRLNRKPFDIDTYITEKATDGLFLKIAEQEKLIRENPAGQASELLRKVFSKTSTGP